MIVNRVIVVFIALFFLTVGLPFYFLGPTSSNDEKKIFVIPLVSSQVQTVQKLKEEGFIRSEYLFGLLTGFKDIESGGYLISQRMNIFTLIKTFYDEPYQKWIVIVPGLRIEQIAERMTKKFNWDQENTNEFLTNGKEGYMFPDTYLIKTRATGKESAQKFLSNFNEKFDSILQADLLKANIRNDTVVKIASLIERESGSLEDKALISGIIWNRLNIGMRLQIDATVQYAMASASKLSPISWWPTVKVSDLKIESPYNTYLQSGLPPTAIASPSLDSIRAAAYPAETDCLFYLHDREKKIHCAQTFEEHLENIEEYLR